MKELLKIPEEEQFPQSLMQSFMFLLLLLSTEDSKKLSKLLSEGFKRHGYWNKYKIIPNKDEVGTNDNPKYIRELLDSRYQGVRKLFIFAYDNTEDNREAVNSHQKNFLSRVKVENYNIEIDERNLYDQPSNYFYRQYDEVNDEVKKVSTRLMIIQLFVYQILLFLK